MASGVCYRICATFEVRVRSQALSSIEFPDAAGSVGGEGGSSTSGAGSAGLRHWTTKEADACVLTALMVLLAPA